MAISVWEVSEKALKDDQGLEKSNKRFKGQVSYVGARNYIEVTGGINQLKWLGPNQIICGCLDHSLKVIDFERSQMIESIFTNHKVVTALDTACSGEQPIALTGHEDAAVRLWDMRSGKSERRFKCSLESHEKYISQVKLNYMNENVFVSGSYDGQAKLWDIRNESKPLYTLARA